jgi:S1-C subfamily serine protease
MSGKVAFITAAVAVGVGIGIGQAVINGRPGANVQADFQQPARPAAIPVARGVEEQNVVTVARQATPTVVGVASQVGSGSGVIIRRDGVILTNAHVVGRSPVVEVSLADGRRLRGEVIGGDPRVDIAVVRVQANDLPVARIGDSDRLEPGQSAIAIGNPFDLDRTVTAGVVSAVGRTPTGLQLETGLIQTDAAINQGNSGGPLLNSRGEVIGINTVIMSNAVGLGFAVPINIANDVAQQILTTGRVRRVFMGIRPGDIVPELAAQFGLPVEEGVVILQVVAGSPAARAGLRVEDIIVAINDSVVRNYGDMGRILRGLAPGSTARVSIVRGRARSNVNVQLAEQPQ